MPATRPHRIVRRAVMVLAAMFAAYFSSWLSCCFVVGAGLLPGWAYRPAQVIFAPIALYGFHEGPGWQELHGIGRWASRQGRSWNPPRRMAD